MESLQQWLGEYSESHQNPTNKAIHNICVPLIEYSLLGLIHLIPQLPVMGFSPYMDWMLVFVLLVMVFYLLVDLKMAVLMLGVVLINMLVIHGIDGHLQGMGPRFYLSVFILAWIGQFIGHKIEGKKPSFFKDLQFLLVGPMWVFYPFYKRLF